MNFEVRFNQKCAITIDLSKNINNLTQYDDIEIVLRRTFREHFWSTGPKLHTEKFTEITFGPLDQKWSFSMPKIAEIIPGTVPVASPAFAEAFQIK